MNIDEIISLINGHTSKENLKLLIGYSKKVPDGGVIVDIGTCEGRSCIAMALNSKPKVKVYTIDPNQNLNFVKHKNELELQRKINAFKYPSQELYQEWRHPIDLLFVDGRHDYTGVKEDVEGWSPLVKSGGFCIFHDYELYRDSVGKAIDEGEGRHYKKVKIENNIYVGERL
ncbi:MAG: class I SAM-dependent methyltransferase [Atribacterota bacterium]|jgi:predicted O-methyltransferase YrrM|nr:class I SAM-dependent methyltransferase [Atribacterota bacterium]